MIFFEHLENGVDRLDELGGIDVFRVILTRCAGNQLADLFEVDGLCHWCLLVWAGVRYERSVFSK